MRFSVAATSPSNGARESPSMIASSAFGICEASSFAISGVSTALWALVMTNVGTWSRGSSS